MLWRESLLALIQCELKAKYNALTGWQLSAKGAFRSSSPQRPRSFFAA
jgi:hypothetical protein